VCSTEALNALFVPVAFLGLFIFYLVMDVMFPVEGEH